MSADRFASAATMRMASSTQERVRAQERSIQPDPPESFEGAVMSDSVYANGPRPRGRGPLFASVR
ncbi:hypothetical protein GCM10022205_38420 [Spinactinospora alkalitolerans]